MLEKDKSYYVAYIDMALDIGRIRGGVKLCDFQDREELRDKLKRTHEFAEDRELSTWYDDGRSLVLFTEDLDEVYSAYVQKLVSIEDRLFKYAGLFRRAVNNVTQIKQTMKGEQAMLERYTPEVCNQIKGALVDLSSDIGDQIRELVVKAISEPNKGRVIKCKTL